MQNQTNVQPITQVQTAAEINYNERVVVDAHECFPEVFQKGEYQVNKRKHRHPDCKPSNEHYIPDVKLLVDFMVSYHIKGFPLPFGLVGETGCGKTDFMLYVCDRLNEPLYIEKITTSMRSEHLEGGFELAVNDQGIQETRKRYSQAAIGYKHGGVILLDEFDKANDDVSTALHLFLEGKPWTLAPFGETIHAHPETKIVCTANTTGAGGHEIYTTSQQLDGALRNRIGWNRAHYPDKFAEGKILKKMFPGMPDFLIQDMIRLANALRDALLGPNRDGNIDNPISSPFSTRNLVHWSTYARAYGQKRSLRDSFSYVYGQNVNEEDVKTIDDAIEGIFKDGLFEKPLAEYLESKSPKKQ